MDLFQQAERNLRLKGVILTRVPGEFQVAQGSKTFASPELDEVIAAGERLAGELASAQAAAEGKRRVRPLWGRRPKYARRAQIRAFNRKRLKAKWAGRDKIAD